MVATTLPRQVTTPAIDSASIGLIREHMAVLTSLYPDSADRIRRGAQTLATARIRREPPGGPWLVESGSHPGTFHRVVRGLSCSCPDAINRELVCRHQWAISLLVASQDAERFDDLQALVASQTCDCGNPKRSGDRYCARCLHVWLVYQRSLDDAAQVS